MDTVVNQDRLWTLEGGLFLIAAILSLIIMFPGEGLGLTVFGKTVWESVGYAATAVFLCHWLFRRKAWRWRIFYPWLVKVPDLSGTWDGELRSGTFGDTHSGHFQGSRLRVAMTIDQQFDHIIAKAFHLNSRNTTLSCTIVGEHPNFQLFLIYSNRPESDDDPHSSEHKGCAIYDFEADEPVRAKWELKGKYWTNKPRRKGDAQDLGTWGFIDLFWIQSELADKIKREELLNSPIKLDESSAGQQRS